ncbi:MAG: GGDEF domain-containing protein [Pseudolabrys sp.]|nr:GGDEF domain-containing protein [Pseudolabrys sp.]
MILITLALMAASYVLLIGVLVLTGFDDALLHYTIATVFTLILAPAAAFPLVIMSDRIRLAKVELEALLRIDGLTELPNRRAFFEKAGEVFAEDGPISLMMIDVDHFKAVNDNYGHDTGDRVLRSVAQSIQQVVAGATGTGVKFAARIGGEEFAVLVEDLDATLADRLANELVLKIGQLPVRGAAHSIAVTVSVGVAHRRHGDSPDMVLRAADGACYRAKRLGRNQWRDADIFDDEPMPQAPAKAMTAA